MAHTKHAAGVSNSNRSSLLPLITFYGLDTIIGLLGDHVRRSAHKISYHYVKDASP